MVSKSFVFLAFMVGAGLVSGHGEAAGEDENVDAYYEELHRAYREVLPEGGRSAFDLMFDDDVKGICNKKALEFGSGFGELARYLAKAYEMDLTGLDGLPCRVKKATEKTPEKLRGRVRFEHMSSTSVWDFDQHTFDIVYSRCCLVHYKKKKDIFEECFRVMKPGGTLIITDFLSYDPDAWGADVKTLIENEDMKLYPDTVATYTDRLKACGFCNVQARDESEHYVGYNNWALASLAVYTMKCVEEGRKPGFDLKAHVASHQGVIRALEKNQLRVFRFIACRPK